MSYIDPVKKIVRRILEMATLASIILTACINIGKKEETQILPPGTYSTSILPLDLMGASKLQELTSIVSSIIEGPVARAQYFPSKNMILVLYAGDGYLRAWDPSTKKMLFEYDLKISSPIGTGIDVSGELVMGAIRNLNQENDYGEMQDYVGGISIWNAQTGELVNCVIYPCGTDVSTIEWQRNLVAGATLDPKGQWVLANLGTIINVSDITGVRASYSTSETNPDDSHRPIAMFAFDPSSQRYAIAFRDGGVVIEELEARNLSWFAPRISLGIYEEQSLHQVKDLVFSANGKWLARLQDGNLSIWKVSTQNGDLYSDSLISDGKLLAFDESSKLLFISTGDKINVWDIEKKQLIREFGTPKITSLAVSSDNRLLIWGDKLGAIHIWGVHN